ncbi:hypothetical protein [Massilia sp. CCM 8734]|uniref:hypothetical protein n=1 Tax=Massilia sp. CCM 8734 TaxID=2609283 RepID=UPI0014223297|nr:hypothetical protein [Massilia sp. CCM 8734]NHZ94258.1 hypothetical protein [Massilia sp. CCM 8734]
MRQFERGEVKLGWPMLIVLFVAMIAFRIFWMGNRDIPADSPEKIAAGRNGTLVSECENGHFKDRPDAPCPAGDVPVPPEKLKSAEWIKIPRPGESGKNAPAQAPAK